MLLPRSHAWTPLQRSLIILAAVLALVGFGTLVYSYERYYRGPSESALYGTWETTSFTEDSPFYFQFRPDQTFSVSSSSAMEEETVFATGRWYAGGPNIYVRFNPEQIGQRRPQIWHIVDIAPDQIRVRFYRDGRDYVYRRVNRACNACI